MTKQVPSLGYGYVAAVKPGISTGEVEALVVEMSRVITHVHFEEAPVAATA